MANELAPALDLVGLTKRFGSTLAADEVTLTVPAGAFYGLVGPNGAGKTTSLSMAVGLLRPDSGTARIFGADVWTQPVAARSDELLAVLDLADVADSTLVIEYSTGMRKKIGLAVALLHAPRLAVLDEPFEGVDPVSAATIRTILGRFVEGGGSVVFSSHVMPLVERLCSHVAVIAAGRVRAAGTLDEVRRGRDLDSVFVELVGGHVAGAEGLAWLES